MKISELIKELAEIITSHGDIEVEVRAEDRQSREADIFKPVENVSYRDEAGSNPRVTLTESKWS